MTWVAVGVTAVGAVGSVVSSNSAKNSQQKATNAALAEQQRQFDLTRSDNATALEARNNSLAQMQQLAGGWHAPTSAEVMATPGYQFGLKQGADSIQNSAAARGGLYSGNAGKALAQYGNDYATTKYDDALNNSRNAFNDQFNRYASISGQGQIGANAINSAGQNYANNASNLISAQGNANAASSIAQGNTYAGLANQLGSAGKSWFGNQGGGSTYTSPSANGSYANPVGNDGYNWNQGSYSQAGGYADGGPVRSEPAVGSRAPVRGGGGGGLSPEAIRNLLAIQVMRQGPANNGIGQLPANPLMRPGVILQNQEQQQMPYAQGGMVRGPGGPRDDMIPARLSNGEHVIDAASVTALGGGSNELGQMKLNKLRAMLKGHHGG